jgi:hypothetical protein
LGVGSAHVLNPCFPLPSYRVDNLFFHFSSIFIHSRLKSLSGGSKHSETNSRHVEVQSRMLDVIRPRGQSTRGYCTLPERSKQETCPGRKQHLPRDDREDRAAWGSRSIHWFDIQSSDVADSLGNRHSCPIPAAPEPRVRNTDPEDDGIPPGPKIRTSPRRMSLFPNDVISCDLLLL